MRITNSTILRGYNRNLNRLQNQKTDSEYKIMSGRSFSRASESPLSAAKALNVRKQLYNTEQYKENLSVASQFYTEAETSLLQVSDELASIRETIIAAVNTYNENTDLQIYAQQLETKASELCSVFNTDTAGRVIFGGESNDPEPFTIATDSEGHAATVLYHGVPVNAFTNADLFPCSDPVYIDIGIGMVIDQTSQQVDAQSVLKISFNGADVTGCGAEGGVADIDLSSIKEDHTYSLDVYAANVKKTITFKAGADNAANVAMIQDALDEAYKYESVKPKISDTGIISVDDGIVCVMNNPNADPDKTSTAVVDNEMGYTDKYSISLSGLTAGNDYTISVTVGGTTKNVTFTAGDTTADSAAAINNSLAAAFTDIVPVVGEDGKITAEGASVSVSNTADSAQVSISRDKTYSNNYIQLTLDAAKALRNGDIEYANGCIDRIVTATSNLLVEIADLGCNEEYIDFNINRFDIRELNLKERQTDLEATDLESEITLMKTYEALYNAALQMSSMVVPNSIFNYI